MKSRTTFVSSIAALALSAVIAVPALAGPPTFSGAITCARGSDPLVGMEYRDDWTKKDIAAYKKMWNQGDNGTCDKGTIDTSALVKNP